MTANPSKLQRLNWKQESAWAENVTSMSGAYAIPALGRVDYTVNQPMVDTMRTTQYRNEGTIGAPGPWDITLGFDMHLAGHGSTTAGAITVQDHETFLGWIFGGGPTRTATSGTTINGGTSTTTNLVTTSSGTFAPGGIFWLGAKGDGAGDGQANVVDTHTLTDLVPEFAVPSAPVDQAVVYSGVNIYTVEDATSSSITGARTQLFTANQQILCHGVFPTSAQLSGFKGGEFPQVKVGLRGSWAEMRADTFPDATAMSILTPAPVAGGSLNIQAYGTTTRQALSWRDLTVDFTLGVQPLPGGDGVDAYQSIVGARRTVDKILITVTLDAPAASTSPTWWTAFLTNGWHHILWNGTAANGQRVAWYAPRCRIIGNRPTQSSNGELNAITLQFEAHADTGETGSALALSAFRICLG